MRENGGLFNEKVYEKWIWDGWLGKSKLCVTKKTCFVLLLFSTILIKWKKCMAKNRKKNVYENVQRGKQETLCGTEGVLEKSYFV